MMGRRAELDALRGMLLVVMALTHLPTRVSGYTNQPFGFVSAAEGFVFLSAFLTGSAYSASMLVRGAEHVRRRLWSRALKLYGYHLALLLFAFTIAAAFAATTGRPALRHLLAFYFDSPAVALIGGSLLLYQPPLFDILPMYIVFLALTPLLLATAAQEGWRRILALSALLWLFAQLGGRRLLYETVVPLTGVHFPMEAGGSFDMFAWQLLWIGGLWVGSRHHPAAVRAATSPRALAAAAAIAAAFFLWRHNAAAWTALGGFYPLVDKWQLGALRLLNFAALALVVTHTVLPLLSWLQLNVFTLLGRASLQVFCAHLIVCVASLALIADDDTPLGLPQEAVSLALMLVVMILVAKRSAAAARAPNAATSAPGGR